MKELLKYQGVILKENEGHYFLEYYRGHFLEEIVHQEITKNEMNMILEDNSMIKNVILKYQNEEMFGGGKTIEKIKLGL